MKEKTCLPTSRRKNGDEVAVLPLVGGLHSARVVGGDRQGADAEHPVSRRVGFNQYFLFTGSLKLIPIINAIITEALMTNLLYFPFHECLITRKEHISSAASVGDALPELEGDVCKRVGV